MPPLITLSTDFGLRDSYVAEMKGVILSNCPEATIVDISHDVPACDVLHGARLLAQAVKQFPADSIHVGVIDPGVGSSRRRLLLRTEQPQGDLYFIGPDNGLFSLVLSAAISHSAWQIDALPPELSRGSSTTFDGRDIFSPVAALLASGKEIKSFSSAIDQQSSPLIRLQIPEPQVRTDGSIQGEIVSFDHFGNAVTNVHRDALGGSHRRYRGTVANHEVGWVTHYQEIPTNSVGLLFNSQGYVEIAARQQSAKDLLRLQLGTACQLSLA